MALTRWAALFGAGAIAGVVGTRWHQVIAALDPLSLSPKVMQSNADFGVASTSSVGAHGWPMPFGPMGSTVRPVQMVLADGGLVRASRTESADLFSGAMGGYGLIGLITELEVEAVPNQLLESRFQTMPAADFAAAFAAVADGSVPMAYGRLNIDREGFFDDAMLVTYRPVAGAIPPPPDQVSCPRHRAQSSGRSRTTNRPNAAAGGSRQASAHCWLAPPAGHR